ncbi:MAG: C69 family dipeptidase [Planctomycetes bacterium]|nr:C69 family dipeptidase [Planctomycetota bacterium]
MILRPGPALLAPAAILLALPVPAQESDCCTNVLVSRGASSDGSTFVSYSADGAFKPKLLLHAGGDHEPGVPVDVVAWEDDQVRGPVKQVAHTYGVVGLVNEHQLALAETTTDGRLELENPAGLLDYDALMWLTLQRARTAREAIDTIVGLCDEYGYGSTGETLSIADPNEVWMMEIIGRGPGVDGILWVAARVPDGSIAVHANMSRIGEFPRDDPDNWRFAPDVVEFATAHGYYDPAAGRPFNWRHAFHPDDSPAARRVCAAREWSVLRRAAPSLNLSPDYHRSVPGAQPYPLFVPVDRKLTVHDVMALMRDHYEGTPFDLTQGIDAGPFGSPYRFRDLGFSVDGVDYIWERAIATQQAGFVMVAQCRGWLPDPIGGVYWYAPDDCYTSAFTPLYCGITKLPPSYTNGDYGRFSWDSAWWIANLVSNLTYDRWSRVIGDVLAAQRAHEDAMRATMPAIERAATDLLATDPALARRFLTDWSVASAERLFADWQELATTILTKHLDGYVRTPDGPQGVGYPESWLRRVIAERGEQLALPKDADASGG